MQRVFIHATSKLVGTFSLSLGSYSTRQISVDTTQDRLSDEIAYSLRLDSIKVVSVDLGDYPGIPGDYRAWDIEFVSVAGTMTPLVCNSQFVGSDDAGVSCTVTTQSSATSVPLSGKFTLLFKGMNFFWFVFFEMYIYVIAL